MKIRKHKNNRTFKIVFRTRGPNKVYTRLDGNNAVKVTEEGERSPIRSLLAIGSCWQSVYRAFMFGRDQNTVASVLPV